MSTFGKRLTSRSEAQQRFPGLGTGGVRLLTNGRVGSIFISANPNRNPRYKNEIGEEEILYCHTPLPRAHRAMEAAFEAKTPLPVQISDGSSLSYDWGDGIIAVLNDQSSRYVIRRQAAPEGCGDTVSEAADGHGDRTSKVREDEYDSLLEKRHAIVMRALGMEFCRSKPGVPRYDVQLPNEEEKWHVYQPDFNIYNDDGSCDIVEIKPRYPYDDEMRRCEQVAHQTRARVFLLHGTQMTIPFSCKKRKNGELPSYEHAEGIRGMLFQWDNDKKKVTVRSDVGYSKVQGAAGRLEVRTEIGDSAFENEELSAAFESAAATTAR